MLNSLRMAISPSLRSLHTKHSLQAVYSKLSQHSRHIGLPEHDAVDRVAKQATSFVRIIDNTCIPVSDYKNHDPKFILHTWNTHWKNQPS